MPRSILIIDDCDADAAFTLIALERCQMCTPVMVANNAEEGLEVLMSRLERPDELHVGLILLDLKLPKVDGFELLTLLKAHPRLSEVPVIIVTGSTLIEDQRRANALGAAGFVTKLLDLSQFVDLVCQVLAPYRTSLQSGA